MKDFAITQHKLKQKRSAGSLRTGKTHGRILWGFSSISFPVAEHGEDIWGNVYRIRGITNRQGYKTVKVSVLRFQEDATIVFRCPFTEAWQRIRLVEQRTKLYLLKHRKLSGNHAKSHSLSTASKAIGMRRRREIRLRRWVKRFAGRRKLSSFI